MDFKIILWILILAVVGLMGGGKKKTSNQQPARRNAAGNPEAPKPLEPVVETVQTSSVQRNERKRSNREPVIEEYFTYEKPVDWNKEQKSNPVFVEEEVPVTNPLDAEGGFDLRKALIYQTILQNNYIADLK